MSSAEAMVDDVVVGSEDGRDWDATRAATAFAVLAVTQLAWLAAMIYGAVWLLT